MSKTIYLDYNASTPIDPAVQEVMIEALSKNFGNASSTTHSYGWQSQNLLKSSRRSIAKFIQAQEKSILFTSGATESNNLILKAVFQAFSAKGVHIITSEIEHSCILKCCQFLEKQGAKISYLSTDKHGQIRLDKIPDLITPETRLISVMAANHETGVIQDLKQAIKFAHAHKVLFHSDATQWIGKLPFDIADYPADFLSFSAHKFYGPKGVGAIYAKDLTLLRRYPLVHGGGQEMNIRSGTVNVPSIVGFGKCAEISQKNLVKQNQSLAKMKNWFVQEMKKRIPGIIFNGDPRKTLPGTVNFYLPKLASKELLALTQKKISMSTGSACTSASQEPSYVLVAMGVSKQDCQGSIRLSFGRFTSMNDLITAVKVITAAYEKPTSPLLR